jgi:quercetin dioxygenase-like cupin family protein
MEWEKGELHMFTVHPNEMEVEERWYESDPTMRFKIALPFNAETGNKDSAVGYFEVEPGNALPAHTDSAEEILLCLEGRVEITLGNERSQISAGDMALVPAMVPHALRNGGTETVRVVGFFSRVVVETTFEQPLMPSCQRVFSTPPPG